MTQFERQQRHQGRQHPQTSTETRSSTSTQCGQCRNDEAGSFTFTQHNMYNSIQAGPSTSACNEPTTINEYNLINVNEYCMFLYQQIGSSTSVGQGFEGLHNYDHYPQLVQHLPPITHRHLHPILGNTIMTRIANPLPHNIHIQLYMMTNPCLIHFIIINIHIGSTAMNNMTCSSHHNLPNHPLMFGHTELQTQNK